MASRSRNRRRHRDGRLSGIRLDLLTVAWLARLLARAMAGDARRTLRRRRLGWH